MQIFDDGTGNGDSVIILSKQEGQALLRALEFATAPKHTLKEMKALSRSSKAHKVASEIEAKLACY